MKGALTRTTRAATKRRKRPRSAIGWSMRTKDSAARLRAARRGEHGRTDSQPGPDAANAHTSRDRRGQPDGPRTTPRHPGRRVGHGGRSCACAADGRGDLVCGQGRLRQRQDCALPARHAACQHALAARRQYGTVAPRAHRRLRRAFPPMSAAQSHGLDVCVSGGPGDGVGGGVGASNTKFPRPRKRRKRSARLLVRVRPQKPPRQSRRPRKQQGQRQRRRRRRRRRRDHLPLFRQA